MAPPSINSDADENYCVFYRIYKAFVPVQLILSPRWCLNPGSPTRACASRPGGSSAASSALAPSVALPSQELLILAGSALNPAGARCDHIPLTSRRSWEQIRPDRLCIPSSATRAAFDLKSRFKVLLKWLNFSIASSVRVVFKHCWEWARCKLGLSDGILTVGADIYVGILCAFFMMCG